LYGHIKKNEYAANAGFTLLEVLIAITITGLVIAVLSSTLIQATYGQHLLEERLTALIIGQGKLSELIYGSESGLSGDFAAPYINKYKWNASEESLEDGNTKITLTVEWRDSRDFLHQTVLIGYSQPE
jgi:prepilin-type N-terminal cleavage/methylation domain-containing protein